MYRMVRLYLAIIILVSPMPVGANRPWIAYLFAAATLAVSSLVLLYSGLSRKIASPPIHLYPLLAIAFLWLLYTALQIFSGEYFLPKFGVLDNIKPDALLATYNDAPQWLPLSLIPEASLYHLALGCMYFLFFFFGGLRHKNSKARNKHHLGSPCGRHSTNLDWRLGILCKI